MSTINRRKIVGAVIYDGNDMPHLGDLRRAAENAQVFEDEAAKALEAARSAIAEGGRAGDTCEQEIDAYEAAKAETVARQNEYDAFVDEAAERATTIMVQDLGRKRFRDLMADHPPRKVTVKDDPPEEGGEPVEREVNHPDDAGFGVNTETYPMALLAYIDPDNPDIRTIVQPEFASRKAVQDFLDNDLAEGDFPGLWAAAHFLNRMPSANPKELRYSSAPRSSAATSK